MSATTRKRTALRASLVVAITFATGLAAEPHPHQGVLAPYAKKPPVIEITPDEAARLDAGKPVMRQSEAGMGGRGVAVQDIAAPTDVVWGRILDFAAYPKMIDDVKEIEVYEEAKERTKVRFVIGRFGLSLEYFIDHVVKRDEGFMTWTLDYSRKSELDDSVGYWYVAAHPTKKDVTRLFYSVDVRMKGFVPGFIQDLVREEGLVRATKWVKLHAERAHADARARAATSSSGTTP